MLFEKTPGDVQNLLPVPIKQLGLKLEGSQIERYVEQLFKEFDAKGLKHFRPAFYLTSEWGCPSEQPVIGVPFYLADPRLGAIESAVNDMEETIEDFYKSTTRDESQAIADLALDVDLDDIFLQPEQVSEDRRRKAAEIVEEHRREIADKVTYWTGARRSLVKSLVEAIAKKVDELGLVADKTRESEQVIELTVYIATLAMNFFSRRRFERKTQSDRAAE